MLYQDPPGKAVFIRGSQEGPSHAPRLALIIDLPELQQEMQ